MPERYEAPLLSYPRLKPWIFASHFLTISLT